ncbi:MAG: prepilin-type N-terminal cleavage/methylation domain-containing protein [Smithella sp.]|jgi:prepilin-type N-terminal cleavage/methylation domain-containing protein
MLKNEKGFTLIEIITVLVILGILAAVAISRYVDMMDQSRISAAQVAIGELKSRASGIYAKLYLSGNGADPGEPAVASSLSLDVGSDFSGITTTTSGSDIIFAIGMVKGSTMSTTPSGTWYYPTQS